MFGIAELKKIIDASDNIVFFGGAGVSTESGIPDFRGGSGLYGEGLDGGAFSDAARAIENAEVLIVGGTSLTVNPAASLIGCYRGGHMIIINKTPTPYDRFAEIILRDPIGEVLGRATETP